MIATDQNVNRHEFESREAKVLEICTSETFELKENIEKMMKGYLKERTNITLAEHTYKKQVA